MSLKTKTLELKKRMQDALQGGGTKAIEKQAAMGKKTARERVLSILDPNSFHEYDLLVEHTSRDFDMDKKTLPGDGVITGTGKIGGHPVCIYAQETIIFSDVYHNYPIHSILYLGQSIQP